MQEAGGVAGVAGASGGGRGGACGTGLGLRRFGREAPIACRRTCLFLIFRLRL